MQCVARIAKANERIESPLEKAVFAARVRDDAPGMVQARLLEPNLKREGV